MRIPPALLLATILLPLTTDAHQVIGIQDGDTLTLLVNRKPLKIRLADIDAPEKKQAFGQASKQSLSEMCFGNDAAYDARTIDKYGRTVARVKCAGVDVNRAQVERGLAWVYSQYNTDSSLPSAQVAARSSRKGLWADKAPMPPWDFRHQVKQTGYQPKSVANESTCRTGPRGGRYQIINGHKRYGC